MSDTSLRFSKTAVDRAGRMLIDDPQNEEALEVLDYWRSLHAEPLESALEPTPACLRGDVQVVLVSHGVSRTCGKPIRAIFSTSPTLRTRSTKFVTKELFKDIS